MPDGSRAPEAYLWTSLRRCAERGEESAALLNAVAGLPSKFRSVVERRFLWGESVAQVAHALAIPGATVATRTYRGLALLRPRLERYQRAVVALLIGLTRRVALAGLLVGVGIGPAAEVAITDQHRPVPVQLEGDGQPTWLLDPPASGFPYADHEFVARPLPEA